jgi:hypothetical protein
MDSAFKLARGKSLTDVDHGGGARRTPVMRASGGGALVAVDSFLDPPLNPDTCEALVGLALTPRGCSLVTWVVSEARFHCCTT